MHMFFSCLFNINGFPSVFPACGGVLTESRGTLSSPNHPGLYPPDSHCVWAIRVSPQLLVQIYVSSLAVEGPSPCLFDWLEVREETEKTSALTRCVGPYEIRFICSQIPFNFFLNSVFFLHFSGLVFNGQIKLY